MGRVAQAMLNLKNSSKHQAARSATFAIRAGVGARKTRLKERRRCHS
jgi:hypothetical protein